MRTARHALVVVLASALVVAVVSPAVARTARIDECKLLTVAQAETIMGTEPFGGGSPDNGGCSWQTDPSDRASGLAYVTLKVDAARKVLADYDDDLRTYLDESTNVGIDELPGVGDEAFSTYSPLSGPGTSDGLSVLVGDRLLRIGFQRAESVQNPSDELDQIVRIVKKAVAKVRAKQS
jgi:hypothetical protein